MSSLVTRARSFAEQTTVVTAGRAFRFGELLGASHAVASALLANGTDLDEARVAFLVPPGFDYLATQWGIWRAGGIAVPMAVNHPPPELDYVIEYSGASILMAHPELEPCLRPLAEKRGLRLLTTSEVHLMLPFDGATCSPAKLFRHGPQPGEHTIIHNPAAPLDYADDRFHDFINHLNGTEELCVKPSEALVVQRILDAVAESCATGREVRL